MADVSAQPERAHVHEKTDCALRAGAGAMLFFCLMHLRTRIVMRKFFLTILRTRIMTLTYFPTLLRAHTESPYVTEIYDLFHLWHARPWSLLSFFSKEEWKVTKEEVAGR